LQSAIKTRQFALLHSLRAFFFASCAVDAVPVPEYFLDEA
jgi:hypothetical protein